MLWKHKDNSLKIITIQQVKYEKLSFLWNGADFFLILAETL